MVQSVMVVVSPLPPLLFAPLERTGNSKEKFGTVIEPALNLTTGVTKSRIKNSPAEEPCLISRTIIKNQPVNYNRFGCRLKSYGDPLRSFLRSARTEKEREVAARLCPKDHSWLWIDKQIALSKDVFATR